MNLAKFVQGSKWIVTMAANAGLFKTSFMIILTLECCLQVVKCEGLKKYLDHNWRMHLLQTTQSFREKLQADALRSGIHNRRPLQQGFQFRRKMVYLESESTIERTVFIPEEKLIELQDEDNRDGTDSDYISHIAFAVGRFSKRQLHGETYNSPHFYTIRGGYKFPVRIKPNSVRRGAGTLISLYFISFHVCMMLS